MSLKLVSVIIPAYNAEHTLEKAVTSAASQTYENLEILVVNDGSTDGTLALAERLAGKDSRIRVLDRKNGGVSRARNEGLLAAAGEDITFLDADDWMEPSMIRTLEEVKEEQQADIAGCGFTGGKAPGSGKITLRTGADIVREGILKSDTRVWSKVFSRRCIGTAAFREGLTIGEDMLFLLDVMLQEGAGLVRTDAPYYFYWQNPKGAMARPYTPSYMDQIRCWEIARKKIASARPALLKEPETEGLLSLIDVVSALLVSSKIARLPDKERKGAEEDFQTARKKVKEGLLDRNARAVMPPEYRIKAELLKRFPRIYESLYQGRTK